MADKNGLRVVGLVFAAFTAATMLIAAALVQAHVAGRTGVGGARTLVTAESMPAHENSSGWEKVR